MRRPATKLSECRQIVKSEFVDGSMGGDRERRLWLERWFLVVAVTRGRRDGREEREGREREIEEWGKEARLNEIESFGGAGVA